MKLSSVYLVNRHLQRANQRDIKDLQTVLDPLPRGYAEYLTTLGSGMLCDTLTLWGAQEIRRNLPNCRYSIEEILELLDDVPKVDFVNAIPIGMSLDGDQLVVCPDRPRSIFVLPRHDRWVYRLPRGLERPLLWERVTDKSTRYSPKSPFYFFQSNVRSASVAMFAAEHFHRSAIAATFERLWSNVEVRRIAEEDATFLFPRAIEGRVQLTGGVECGDGRVGVDISFDSTASKKVEAAVKQLEQLGFYVIDRFPKSRNPAGEG